MLIPNPLPFRVQIQSRGGELSFLPSFALVAGPRADERVLAPRVVAAEKYRSGEPLDPALWKLEEAPRGKECLPLRIFALSFEGEAFTRALHRGLRHSREHSKERRTHELASKLYTILFSEEPIRLTIQVDDDSVSQLVINLSYSLERLPAEANDAAPMCS